MIKSNRDKIKYESLIRNVAFSLDATVKDGSRGRTSTAVARATH